MEMQRLEARVLSLVDSVISGSRIEDNRVEAKKTWPTDFRRAARQIAGLANASRGQDVLWIIGLDEDAFKVSAPADVEMAEWWPQVRRCFAELAPELKFQLVVPTPHGPIIALLFGCTRTPYLITTSGVGGVDREVPWREGNSTRSAHRSELIQAVISEALAPGLEVVRGWARLEILDPAVVRVHDAPATPVADAEVHLEVYVDASEPVRLPQHRWSFELHAGALRVPVHSFSVLGPIPPSNEQPRWGYNHARQHLPESSISYVAGSGLHVNGSDKVTMTARARVAAIPTTAGLLRTTDALQVDIAFGVGVSEQSARVGLVLGRRELVKMSGMSEPIDCRVGEYSFGPDDKVGHYSGQQAAKSATTT